jgi:PTS system galactitol-specific IIA component
LKLIDSQYLFTHQHFANRDEALTALASALTQGGRVKDSYQKAIFDREAIFPTGLPTGKIGVAIPHADSQHVNQSTIAVATLNHPVTFQNMGDPDSTVDVSIIIMLAIAEPKGQITMLQKLMSIVQNQEHLDQLLHYDQISALQTDLEQTFAGIQLA